MNEPIDHAEDVPRFAGHQLLDENSEVVGTIVDVVFDNRTERPVWGVVDPGLLKAAHYVPLVPPTYVTRDGGVKSPYTKRLIMHAPKAKRGHILTPVLERELEHHYSLAD